MSTIGAIVFFCLFFFFFWGGGGAYQLIIKRKIIKWLLHRYCHIAWKCILHVTAETVSFRLHIKAVGWNLCHLCGESGLSAISGHVISSVKHNSYCSQSASAIYWYNIDVDIPNICFGWITPSEQMKKYSLTLSKCIDISVSDCVWWWCITLDYLIKQK